jgi:beta-xylosidase
LKANDPEGILQLIDKVISLGCKSEKQKSLAGSRKVQSKPKVRYFKIKIDDFSFEVATSSFTNISFREKNTVTTMLNNMLYSKLPNILQSTISQKYLVLTLNPIVDLYEECKNTLSTTFCKFVQEEAKE